MKKGRLRFSFFLMTTAIHSAVLKSAIKKGVMEETAMTPFFSRYPGPRARYCLNPMRLDVNHIHGRDVILVGR
jgi:hypothetical protein